MTAWLPTISLCNEVLGREPFFEQCRIAAQLGYDGLEIAPFTLSDAPHRLTEGQIKTLRRMAEDQGLRITGLHWLLVKPEGLSITSSDPVIVERTRQFIARLIDVCAGLGGQVLVHGSPEQRRLGADPGLARAQAQAFFAFAGARAQAAGVDYCIEPLAPQLSDYITTFDDALAVVRAVGCPHLTTMIDTSSAALGERVPVADLIARALPSGHVRHIHLNDRNRRGPGQGLDQFAPVLAALRRGGYSGIMAIEPFVYEPDGVTTAARSIGYVRGLLEGLS